MLNISILLDKFLINMCSEKKIHVFLFGLTTLILVQCKHILL